MFPPICSSRPRASALRCSTDVGLGVKVPTKGGVSGFGRIPRVRNLYAIEVSRACNSVQCATAPMAFPGENGIVEPASYRIYKVLLGSNPTLSANFDQ